MLNRQTIKIFVASSSELSDERRETVLLITELNKRYPTLHIEPVLFELDTSSGNNPGLNRIQDKINTLLDESDIILVMFYSRIGEFTKEEFVRAKNQNKKIFFYLKKGFAPTKKDEGLKHLELLALKDEIEKESEIRYEVFEKLSDFQAKLYKDLQKYLDDNVISKEPATVDAVTSFSARIPFAPRPYFAPAFSLSKKFTGRAEEMNMLSKWFLLDKEPIFILEAIGGMGKSSLAWQWLQNEIVQKQIVIEGIVWWSFYNQGFDDFIDDCLEYCIHEPNTKDKKSDDKLTLLTNLLSNKRFVLVLDGFETQLRAYADMMGVYQNEKLHLNGSEMPFDLYQRECVNPKAEKFFKNISSGNSKILVTTRLFPQIAENLNGVRHKKLTGLSDTDTITFFKSLGIDGSPQEIINVAKIYDFHPLMLNHLAVVLSRSRFKNINEAYKHNIIDQKEPQRILNTSYSVLSEDEKKIATSLSIFRLPFDFEAISAIIPDISGDELWDKTTELVNLGFLSYEESEKLFDFHPVNRLFLYNQLTNKKEIHQKAILWLENKPETEIIQSPEDMIPVFELIFHLIKAGLLGDAFDVYEDRVTKYLWGRFERPTIEIELLSEFIKDKQLFSDQLSQFQQSHLLTCLGVQLSKTLKTKEGYEYLKNSTSLYSPLKYDSRFFNNLALQGTILTDFSNCISSIILATISVKNVINKINKVQAFRYLARAILKQKDHNKKFDNLLLNFKNENKGAYADKELCKIMAKRCLFGDSEYPQSHFFKYYSKYVSKLTKCIIEDLTDGVFNELIIMNILLADAIIRFIQYKIKLPKKLTIKLLNNEFTAETTDFDLNENNCIDICFTIITKMLLKIRETSFIYLEPEALLLLGKIEWLKIMAEKNENLDIDIVINSIEESLRLAKKDNNLDLQAEIHLFCAEALLSNVMKNKKDTLLNSNALTHLKLTKELCLDKSTIEDLFKPKDDMDEFYKDIPEYLILKRGLTEREKIEFGNYNLWKKADDLMKKIN